MKRLLILVVLLSLAVENLCAQSTASRRAGPATEGRSTPTLAVPLGVDPDWTSGDAGAYSTGMVWRDFNNDGGVDVFFSNGNDMARARNTAYFLQNRELPTVPTWQSANPEYSGHCAAGDVNDDGLIDIVVANFLGENRFASPGHTNLYLNLSGYLATTPGWIPADSFYSFSCALGDVDGDGDLDLAVATGEPYNAFLERDRLYLNDNGVLQPLPAWQSDALTAAMDVAWGDIDRDGDLDLAFCYDNLPAAVYFNTDGAIAQSPGWQSALDDPANTVILGDINGDGWLDLLVAYNDQLGGSGLFAAYLNDGAGSLHSLPDWTSADGGYGSALALYDYDLDGDLDLAAGRWFDRPRVYENVGGTLSAQPVWRANVATTPEEMAWIDVDASGVQLLADTIPADGRRLLYASHTPWYLLDSVVVDGVRLGDPDFCYDPIAGWVSLAVTPLMETRLYYQYSFTADLAVANWDLGNHVYTNTSEYFVNFEAAPSVGWSPLTVQFTDYSTDALAWQYDFGDGEVSSEPNPMHTYHMPGAYDVTLSVEKTTGWLTRVSRNLIVALSDTISFGCDSVFPGEPIMIPVQLTNTQPLTRITIPISIADQPIDIRLDSVTLGQRTAAFGSPDFVTFVHTLDRYDMTIALASPTGESLPAGSGEVLRMYASTDWYAAVGVANPVDTISNPQYRPSLVSSLLTYEPGIATGAINSRFVARGDVNSDSRFSLTDLTRLVNFLFWDGPRPVAAVACDVNADGEINLTDLTYLVNFLFLAGPPPPPYSGK